MADRPLVSNRVWTIPNVLSFLRLLGVPFFLALILLEHDVAAVIVEPVAGSTGVLVPPRGYLKRLREICDRHGILLIFDEVMTGFRVHPGGATARFGIAPDLVTLGKIIGGGLPVGAYGGRKGEWNVESVLELFPLLKPLLKRQASSLSGGEQQALAEDRQQHVDVLGGGDAAEEDHVVGEDEPPGAPRVGLDVARRAAEDAGGRLVLAASAMGGARVALEMPRITTGRPSRFQRLPSLAVSRPTSTTPSSGRSCASTTSRSWGWATAA